MRVNDQ
jgi:IS5 family transposase